MVITKKVCKHCGLKKPLTEEFWRKDSSKKSGFTTHICKACKNRQDKKVRHTRNPESYQHDIYTKRQKIRMVRELKEITPCADCGVKYPYYILDYDHREPKEKLCGIGRMLVQSFSWTEILEEIAKCDLVCANCHRERTWGPSKSL